MRHNCVTTPGVQQNVIFKVRLCELGIVSCHFFGLLPCFCPVSNCDATSNPGCFLRGCLSRHFSHFLITHPTCIDLKFTLFVCFFRVHSLGILVGTPSRCSASSCIRCPPSRLVIILSSPTNGSNCVSSCLAAALDASDSLSSCTRLICRSLRQLLNLSSSLSPFCLYLSSV